MVLRFVRSGSALVAATLVVALSACGFHLRGVVDIPPELNPMYIEAPGGSPVRAAIVQRLSGSQVQLAAKPQDARVIIRIANESRSSRVAAVDRDGKVLASELHYRVAFEALAADGEQRVPQQALDLVRTYENPDVEVLGKQLEADLIYEDLIQEAADRILGRLRAALL
ncbi:MAG: LPS assembly lipoprotein LptE [Pseudomonadota bacterium]|nr:LPS assembly lipoprotein LptE [Pseudomonadota bacterium]